MVPPTVEGNLSNLSKQPQAEFTLHQQECQVSACSQRGAHTVTRCSHANVNMARA